VSDIVMLSRAHVQSVDWLDEWMLGDMEGMLVFISW